MTAITAAPVRVADSPHRRALLVLLGTVALYGVSSATGPTSPPS